MVPGKFPARKRAKSIKRGGMAGGNGEKYGGRIRGFFAPSLVPPGELQLDDRAFLLPVLPGYASPKQTSSSGPEFITSLCNRGTSSANLSASCLNDRH
jgi:hypothetical protein